MITESVEWMQAAEMQMQELDPLHRMDWKRALAQIRSEEHTSELQSRLHFVCRVLLEKKNTPLTASKTSEVPTHRRPIEQWRLVTSMLAMTPTGGCITVHGVAVVIISVVSSLG